jgi:hypothetical protein
MARWQPSPRLYSPDKELPLAIVGRPLPRPNIILSRDTGVLHVIGPLAGNDNSDAAW